MSFLLRSVASSSRRVTNVLQYPIRFNSTTTPASDHSTPNPNPPLPPLSKNDEKALNLLLNPRRVPQPKPDLSGLNVPDSSIFADPNVDSWWTSLSRSERSGYPGNQFQGRQELKTGFGRWEFDSAYKRLMRKLRNSNVRRELQLGEYYEKPGEKKRRLVSERHRRRFQEMVRRKVQLVQTIRNRG